MKSGTTSLHNYLAKHPDVFASKVKEIDFFVKERSWDKGLDWYKNQFDSSCSIRFESSQNYTKRHVFKDVPERILSILGKDVKLIYITRDPIDRIKSHFIENFTAGEAEASSLEEVFKKIIENNQLESNKYVQTSMYSYQLQPYLELFESKNIYILSNKELRKDTFGEVNKIFNFLGLDQLKDATVFEKNFNSGGDKNYFPFWYYKLRNKIYKIKGGYRFTKLIESTNLLHVKFRKNQTELSIVTMEKLEEVFIQDQVKLNQIVNKLKIEA